jgi:hypothetical protein
MQPIEMTVEELSGLEVEKHLVIVTAGIENSRIIFQHNFFAKFIKLWLSNWTYGSYYNRVKQYMFFSPTSISN